MVFMIIEIILHTYLNYLIKSINSSLQEPRNKTVGVRR